MADIKEVIDMMVADGRPEEEIVALIDRYNKDQNVGNQTGSTEDPTMSPNITGSQSDDGLSESVQDRTAQPNVVVPEITGGAPDITMEDVVMTDEQRVEFDRKSKAQRKKAIEGQKLYLREKQIQEKTGILPSNYPTLQIGTEKQSYMGQVTDVPLYERADLDKMEEITSNVTSEYRNVFNSLLSNEFETLQNYSERPDIYGNQLNQVHDQVFLKMQEKYPGLNRGDFADIVGRSGDGLFQSTLNKVTAEDKERDDAENLKGAQALDENTYKKIFQQTSANFSPEELKKQELNTLIRKENRKLATLEKEGGDIQEINRLKSVIKKHQKDIQKLATIKGTGPMGEYTNMFGPAQDTKNKKLASSYMDNETTKYRQAKKEEAKNNLQGSLNTQLQDERIKNPKLTDFEAHELLYKSKAYNLQQLWVAGNEETTNLKFNRTRNPQLYNKLKEAGINVGDNLDVNVDVPLKTLFDAGYDGRDFDGLSGFLNNIDISEEDRQKLLNYESAIYRNKGELELLHELTYVNNDPATFDQGGTGGAFVRSTISAVATHFTDISEYEADRLASLGPGATESKMLEEFEKLSNTYNTAFKDKIAKGEIDELGFTPEQLKAIEKTFGEEVGEGFGHFVPMLIELGIISAATGATMTATGAARVLAGMRNAGGYKKAQYHAVMTMVEEGKMFAAGFQPGAGAGFYAGGQLTKDVTPFKKRFKWMDPLFQKVVKGGHVGAASSQIAFNLETGIQDLMGNADFKAAFDKHYGDLTFKDVIVESIVFSIAGATHVKKTDFMSTRRKIQAMEELNTKMSDLIKNPTGKLGKEGVDRALETAFTTGPDGKIVRTRPEGYEMMSKEQQTKWEALNEASKRLDQMIKVETTAVELDPNNKNFESNVDRMFTQPINETLKSVNREFEGFKVEFTENPKDSRFTDIGADGAAFIPGKGKEPGTALFLKNKFTPEKMTHEVLGHAGLESYFNRNPQAKAVFQKNISKLFEKFDFQAYDGTPLGEFIKKNYSKQIGKGNNIEPKEFFAYMFELLTDPKIYYQKVAPTFFKEAKQELLSVLEESTGMKPKIRTARQFVDYIGRLSMDARRGLNIEAKVARLADLDDISFLGIEFVENNKKLRDQQAFGSKNISKENLEKAKNNRELTEKYKELDAKEPTQGNNIRKGNVLFELRENNKGILTNYVKDFYKDVPGSNLTEKEFKSYVENNEFLKILNTYNKRAEKFQDVPFNAYLEGVLRGGGPYGGGRMGNILKGLGVNVDKAIRTVSRDAEGFTETELADTGAPMGTSQTPSVTKGIELVYKLPVEQKTIDAITKKIETLDLENLDYKTLVDQAPKSTKEMFGKSTKDKAQFIADNWKTIYESLPKNLTETTGTATGIENSLMSRVVSKETPGAYKTVNKKGKVVYRKNVFYKGEGETVKMKDTGAKTGTELQPKIEMNKEEFLKELGIVEKPDGSLDISSLKADRNITTSLIPALINQTGKAITNQVVRTGLREKYNENPEMITNINIETLLNQVSSGKSESLASKDLGKLYEKYDIKASADQRIMDVALYGRDMKTFQKLYPKKYEAIKDWVEAASQQEAKIGKENEVKFSKETKKLPYDFAKNGTWQISEAKFKNDINLLNEFQKQAFDLAETIPLSKNMYNGNAGILRDLFTGHYSVIRGITKWDKVDSPFKMGLRNKLMSTKESPLSEQTLKRWKEFDFEGLKSSYASSFYTGLRKIYETSDLKTQKELAKKYFNSKTGKLQVELYDLWNTTLQEWVFTSEKGSKEWNNKMNFVARIKKHNGSIGTTGERVLAPGGYVYLPGKITKGTVKYEHMKSSSEQSFESLSLIADGTYTTKGKEGLKKYKGIYGMLNDFNMVDKQTGKVNNAGVHRFAESLELAKNIYSIESGFKRSLYQDIVSSVGKKRLNELIKNDKILDKNLEKQLAKVGFASKDLTRGEKERRVRIIDNAIKSGRDKKKTARGMSTFDFDETLVVGGKNFVTATKGKETIKISSEKFPIDGPKLAEQGYKFDFKDFVNVKGGVEGPLMQKLRNQIKKYGNQNVYVLTARMQEAAPAIHAWLKSKGVELPIENITGLGNSTGEAKAMWMLEKFSEGYNDMYFVDDALPNVKAVRNVLNQLDIKSKVQQALASKDLGKEVNNIMEHSLDISSEKVFSKAEAKVRGKDIKRRRVFMRDSAADLELLIEPLYGKGKKGTENKKWFKKEFIMPFERGIRDYNTARQSAKNDYINLRRQNKDVVKEISKEVEGTTFTNDMAMRVYLWNKAGYKIPDLAKATEKRLVDHINNSPKLKAYAEQFARITKQEKGLKEPGENWWSETMAGEVTSMDRGVSRKQYLQEFIDIKNEIFTEANLNKMESKLGTRWRENIEDMFDRMETGRTRSIKMDRGSAAMMNYLNGGIGTIMNFNTRSAVLQTISTTNFLNMRENNPISAARAMGNVKQFSKDFMFIMNSDMLKQRRDGLSINVTEAEIASAAAASKNPIQSIISKVLKAGYLPTKMADSFAISLGGATFYRNRIKMYEKQGMETKAAEKKAFLDFQVLAERTQQSSRADLLSKQQTSLIGRFILPFANTPMQMNRAGMKDILDISKGRFKGGRELTEKIGRISYYMGAQVAVFAGLQSALFAMLLNDDDVPAEQIANTKSMMLNSTADSFLRGFGIQGAVMSAFKNATQEYFKQSAKGYKADYSEVGEDLLNISPPIGSKFGMLDRAGDELKWDKTGEGFKFKLGNPSLEASLMAVQGITNAPVYSPYQNAFNLKHAMSDQYETWQRVLMATGWTPYSVGIKTEKKKSKKKKKKPRKFRVL